MDLQQRINAFAKLGLFLGQFTTKGIDKNDDIEENDLFFDGFKHQIKIAEENNGWFSKTNILFSLESWSNALIMCNINKWLEKYNFNESNEQTIAIIRAGNIPFV